MPALSPQSVPIWSDMRALSTRKPQLPVTMRWTSCRTVGMNPFE